MNSRTSRWIILAVVGAALIFAATLAGWTVRVIEADNTGIIIHMTTGVTLIGFLSLLRSDDLAGWMCDQGLPLMCGLLGTLVGFMSAVAGLVDDNAVSKMSGVSAALSTTVAGLVLHMYLLVSVRILRR